MIDRLLIVSIFLSFCTSRATCKAAKAQATEVAGDAKREMTARRCDVLLKRCFGALLCEGDDGVREHCARLWRELLKGLVR